MDGSSGVNSQGPLLIRHVLPQRVRLQWPADVPAQQIDALCRALAAQSWLRGWRRSEASRSLVLELDPSCSAVRWQLALAALGWQLSDQQAASAWGDSDPGNASLHAAQAWQQVCSQMGATMLGSLSGQLLLGGVGSGLGLLWFGSRGALMLGGAGALLGAVVGSVLGSAVGTSLANNNAKPLPDQFAHLTWQKLGTRLGEEAGSNTGRLLGSALAGPLGGVAGLAVGSLLGGHLASDFTAGGDRRAQIGQRDWFAQIARDGSSDALSEKVGLRLGAALTGGSVVGQQLGASLGVKFNHAIDWNATLHHHQLLPRQQSSKHPSHSDPP